MNVTIKDIAKEVGLSWQAVSEILREKGRYSPATRQKVVSVAERLGYKRHSSALSLRNKSTGLIAVMVRNAPGAELTNLPALETVLGINHQFQEYDMSTLLVRAGDLLADGAQEPRVFREKLVDGLIAVGSFPESFVGRVRSLIENVVWVDGPVWEARRCLRRDEVGAGRLAARALLSLGYRELVYLGRGPGRTEHFSNEHRRAGVVSEAGGVRVESVAWPEKDIGGQLEILSDRRLVRSGLIAGAVPVARQVLSAAGWLGKSAGRDFGMVCCDDSSDLRATWRNLCRVSFDRFGLGRMAADMMMRSIDGELDEAGGRRGTESRLQAVEWVIGNTAWGPGRE